MVMFIEVPSWIGVLGMVPFIHVPSWVGNFEWVASYDMDPMLIVVVVVVENSQLVNVSFVHVPNPLPPKTHQQKK